MKRLRTVCLKNGCYWLNGGVCSRECCHKRVVDVCALLDIEPPPKQGSRRDMNAAWTAWGKRSLRKLRQFYGRG